MTIHTETDDRIVLTGVQHRLVGVRHRYGQGSMVLQMVSPTGALIEEDEALALARWLLKDHPTHAVVDMDLAEPRG